MTPQEQGLEKAKAIVIQRKDCNRKLLCVKNSVKLSKADDKWDEMHGDIPKEKEGPVKVFRQRRCGIFGHDTRTYIIKVLDLDHSDYFE